MRQKLISTKMKIVLLILLLLSITLYASGCIVLVQSGYKISDYSAEIKNLTHYDLEQYLDYNHFNFNFNSSSLSSSHEINDNINGIEMNFTAQDINVVSDSGKDLIVEIKSNHTINEVLPITENNNKLTISTNYDTPKSASILIRIPESYNKGGIKIITSSGNIQVSNLYLQSLNTSTASGDTYISNINSDYLNVSSSSGEINFSEIKNNLESKITSTSGDISGYGNLGILTGNSTSGSLDIKISDSLKDTSLSSTSGDITLSFPKDTGYKIDYNTLSGEYLGSDSLSSGDESSKITLQTLSGDIYTR